MNVTCDRLRDLSRCVRARCLGLTSFHASTTPPPSLYGGRKPLCLALGYHGARTVPSSGECQNTSGLVHEGLPLGVEADHLDLDFGVN